MATALSYEFFDGNFDPVTLLTLPVGGGVHGIAQDFNVDALAIALTNSNDSFAVRYTGTLNVNTGGTYTLFTTSDDGSLLYIDGALVVNNNFSQGATERSGTVALSAGLHTIEIRYFEGGGGNELAAHISGPDTNGVKTGLLANVVTASDGATVTVNVAPANDAPAATVSGPYNATEQTDLSLKATGLSVSDVDAGAGLVTATLSVTSGRLTVNAGTSGVTVTQTVDNTVTLRGTVAQINALLNTDGTSSLVFRHLSDTPPASVDLTLTVNDEGNTGSGGALNDSDTTTISIAAVNDAPENLSGGPLALTNANEFAANGAVLGAVVVVDPENDPLTYSLTNNAGGRFAINATTGVVTVANGLLLDFEQAASHMIEVSVSDGGATPFVQTIVIGVNDINPETVVGDGRPTPSSAGPATTSSTALAAPTSCAAAMATTTSMAAPPAMR